MLKELFKRNFWFFIPYSIFIIFGGIFLLLNTKEDTHLIINQYNNHFLDHFFYYITDAGDGLTGLVVFVLLALAVAYNKAIFVALSMILSSAVTQILKNVFFKGEMRPTLFFEGKQRLYLVPGVDQHVINSFPSGHSTLAFAMCLSLAIIFEHKILKFLFFLMAFFVAYSRVYLSQHFFVDVYAGSIISVVITLVVFFFITNAHWYNKPNLQKKLLP